MNAIALVGTVTRTPSTKFENDALQVTTLTLAALESGREGRAYTLYVPCIAYGRTAEACSLLAAETLVAVQGKLSWRTRTGKCGVDHSSLVVQVQVLQVLQGAEVPV